MKGGLGKMNYDQNSELLKALGHPVRLRIVEGLMGGDECNVNKIVENLGIPQSTVSQHLKLLKTNGIISFRKEGVQVCYHIIDKRVKDIIKILK